MGGLHEVVGEAEEVLEEKGGCCFRVEFCAQRDAFAGDGVVESVSTLASQFAGCYEGVLTYFFGASIP